MSYYAYEDLRTHPNLRPVSLFGSPNTEHLNVVVTIFSVIKSLT